MVTVLPKNLSDDKTISIKFMRKMSYDHHYLFESIRPNKIFKALEFLVTQPLYKEYNIQISDDCQSKKDIENEDLIDIEKDNPINKENLEPVSEDEWDERNEKEKNESDNLITETLLDPIDMIIKFAPGEHEHPIGIYYDPDAEELSFPCLFAGTYNNFVK